MDTYLLVNELAHGSFNFVVRAGQRGLRISDLFQRSRNFGAECSHQLGARCLQILCFQLCLQIMGCKAHVNDDRQWHDHCLASTGR